VSIFEFFFAPPQKEFVDKNPSVPAWKLWISWNLRNPMPGLSKLLAISKLENQSDWNPKDGWLVLKFANGLPRFVSYRAKVLRNAAGDPLLDTNTQKPVHRYFPWIEVYIGFLPRGVPGASARLTHATGY
jgi:hypothetical protein